MSGYDDRVRELYRLRPLGQRGRERTSSRKDGPSPSRSNCRSGRPTLSLTSSSLTPNCAATNPRRRAVSALIRRAAQTRIADEQENDMATEPSFAQSQQIEALPTPNLPLLRKVLDHIDAHPEEYQQRGWAVETECGTACCIAGHAVAMTEGLVKDGYGDLEPASGREWADAGRAALGITEAESGTGSFLTPGLFCQDNTRAEVQEIAERIAARAGERL